MPAGMPSWANGTVNLADGAGVTDVAGQRERAAGTDGGAVHRRDARDVERAQRQPGRVEGQHPVAQVGRRGVGLGGQPADVAAGAERPARTGHDDAAHASGRPASEATVWAHAAVSSAVIALRLSGRSSVSSTTPPSCRSTLVSTCSGSSVHREGLGRGRGLRR